MPTYGSDILAPRLDFLDEDISLFTKNLENVDRVHNATMRAYADTTADILKDNTLHPDERTQRLKRLEDKVFKDINSFQGNTAQASDTILNSLLNERKDPFYDIDRQYTDVYKTAQANRARLEVEGKSAFMRDASGKEINALPTMFDEDGNLKSRQDFQFDYEGILDYRGAAEKMFDNIEANIRQSYPQLVGNKDLNKIIGQFVRTGSVESPNKNIERVLKKAYADYQQTPEYDQMKRRGIEGAHREILQRAAEERKYTKDNMKETLLSDILAHQRGSGSEDPKIVAARLINTESNPIVGSEKEAKIVNSKVDAVNSSVGGFWKNAGFDSDYSGDKVSMINGKLQEKQINVGGRNISIPLTKSRAESELAIIDNDIAKLEKDLIDRYSTLGIKFSSTSNPRNYGEATNKMKLEAIRSKIDPNTYSTLNNILSSIESNVKTKYDISRNMESMAEFEKSYTDKYKTTIDNLINIGVATDTQGAIMFINNHEMNNSIRDRKSYSTNDIDEDRSLNTALLNQASGIFLNSDAKVYKLPSADSDEATQLDSDDKLKVVKANGDKKDPESVTFSNKGELFNKNSTVYFDPKLKTLTINKEYAIDPQTFKNKYADLAPDMDFLTTVESLTDLSDNSTNKVKRVYTSKGAQPLEMNLNGRTIFIPAGSILNRKIAKTKDGATEVVEVVNPTNGSISTYPLNDFMDAASEAVTEKVFMKLIPKETVGKMRDNLIKETGVAREDFYNATPMQF